MSAPDRRAYLMPRQRAAALATVAEAPPGYVVTVRPPTRSLDQNARLHAMLTEVAASGREFAGCRRTVDEWKVIFVSAHAVATHRPAELVEGIEGEAADRQDLPAARSGPGPAAPAGSHARQQGFSPQEAHGRQREQEAGMNYSVDWDWDDAVRVEWLAAGSRGLAGWYWWIDGHRDKAVGPFDTKDAAELDLFRLSQEADGL